MPGKKKLELEFIIHTASKILFTCISTPSGLSEWFADNVNIRNDVYTFFWDQASDDAKLLARKNQEYMKFKWLHDDDDDSYFQFSIRIDPMTKSVALLITDFCEEDEEEETIQLWDTQVSELKLKLGSV